jgi:hypothetical protein
MVHYGVVGSLWLRANDFQKASCFLKKGNYGLSSVMGHLVGLESFELDFEVGHFVTTKDQPTWLPKPYL